MRKFPICIQTLIYHTALNKEQIFEILLFMEDFNWLFMKLIQ